MPPIILTSNLPDDAKEGLLEFFGTLPISRVFGAVIVTVISLVVVKLLLSWLNHFLQRFTMDDVVKKVLLGITRGALWFVTVILILHCLGLPITSLVAVLSIIGLSFSLALQNFLSNLAGGMQLLASHPFKPGDFVEAGTCSGTVTEIGIFYTKLTTVDNKLIQLPHSTIVSANITNYTAHPTRRVELKVSASYDAPIETVKAVLAQVAADNAMVLGDPEPFIHVHEYGDNAISYIVRVWCTNADYWTVYYDLLEAIKPAFDAAGVEMTYPHVNVHMANSKKLYQ